MTDLFDTAPLPPLAVPPAYGSLSPSEEARLYRDDHGRWVAYVAPTAARKLAAAGADAFRAAWPLMSREYQRAVWRALPEHAQAAFRAALDQGSQSE